MKKLIFLIYCLVIGSISGLGLSYASTVYVTDTFKIMLRTGPSTQNKIIKLLPSGQPVEVIETEDVWSHVKVIQNTEPAPEGWVLSRYLITRLPWKTQVLTLKSENEKLRKKYNEIKLQLDTLVSKEKGLSSELEKTKKELLDLQKKYTALKKGSASYLELRKKYSTLKATSQANMDTIEKLSSENRRLRNSERNKWFALGASVLLCGLLIGIVIGKREKKRRGLIY